MDASKVADLIINFVKKSNLNFCIQESPFSLCINIRKSFIKNKDGKNLEPSRDILFNNNEVTTTEKVKLEEEKLFLKDSNERLKQELQKYYEKVQDLNIKLDKSEKENSEAVMVSNNAVKENEKLKLLIDKNMVATKALENENRDLQTRVKMMQNVKLADHEAFELKNKEFDSLKIKNDELEAQVKDNIELREKLSEIENENLKLKDVLYGCCECGMYTCECDDFVNEQDDCSHTPLNCVTPSQPSPPSAASLEPGSFPWTPPPTPPCVNCGGVNFGPSPSSLCFGCIPPLESRAPPTSSHSPSTTPPGTPPQRM